MQQNRLKPAVIESLRDAVNKAARGKETIYLCGPVAAPDMVRTAMQIAADMGRNSRLYAELRLDNGAGILFSLARFESGGEPHGQ